MVQYYLEYYENDIVKSVSIHNNYKEIVEYIKVNSGIKILQSEISKFIKHKKFNKEIFNIIRIREVPSIKGEKVLSRRENKKKRMKCDCGYSNRYSEHKCKTTAIGEN